MRFSFPLLVLLSLACLAAPLHAQESPPQPHWIWTTQQPGEQEEIYLRKSLAVPSDLKRAILIASADNKAQVMVNGDRRGFTCEDWQAPVIEDITDRLLPGGDNVVAAKATNAGGAAGFLCLIILENKGGQKTFVLSDETWQASPRAEAGWNQVAFTPQPGAWQPAVKLNAAGEPPRDKISPAYLASLQDLRTPSATAPEEIKAAPGFRVELLYSVPKPEQGSWVAMTEDDKGRLIVSDQYGALYRLTPPELGQDLPPAAIEKIDLDIGGAQGLLHAFGALYVVLNTNEHGGRGLYRLRDTNGDDRYDSKELLRKFEEQGGEHGPHAILPGPDGKSLYVVVGNQTPVTEMARSRVPRVWGEDLLLDRIYGRGFMKTVMAPGGWIARTDPEGKEWELIASGFRNQYDAAFDRNGELFTYDADMEWDMNTPWYRPTRVNLVASGADFGWRNGSGKWPAHYPDSLPAVVDIGPGSPTGVTFGHGAKFPKKYQNALYILDWSYGKMYAVHLRPQGAAYAATVEEFISAQPLPLTDALISRHDGAMYFAIGGRRVQSGLYRVTYLGDEPVGDDQGEPLSALARERLALEAYHGRVDPAAIDAAWPYLAHEDRYLRHAARTAIEHQPIATWRDRALAETRPVAAIQIGIALARHGQKADQGALLALLNRIDWSALNDLQRADLVRAYSLAFIRLGAPDEPTRQALVASLSPRLPGNRPELNTGLHELLVYLRDPDAAAKGVDLLKHAPSQEEQIAYAKNLRRVADGWTRELRADYLRWFVQAAAYKGGASFDLFIGEIKQEALSHMSEEEKTALKDIIEAKPAVNVPQFTFEPREFQKNWTVADFDDVINVGLEGARDYTNGRKMFGAASCFACHRFNQEGGAVGPDLTGVAGKFSPRDLLESIVDPNKEISDQYGSMIFTMLDGTQVIGRVMNLNGDNIQVNTNMMAPDQTVPVDRKQLKEMKPSPYSMMPPGLLNTLKKDDVLDLLAYLLSGGNPEDPMFK
ncbi:MAG: c-type cytochrome [Verrucomicrobiales bacterium]|nr:c-type cytochrome [Verrucomicrobiales bacterium]